MDMKHILPTIPRTVAFQAIVGSHNYNLQTENSDKDYKLFVLPSFDDLYGGELFSTPNIVSPTVDYDIHDIRQLGKLLWGANINYMEVLFTTEYQCHMSEHTVDELNELWGLRGHIMRMNLPKFYASCMGTHRQKMMLLHKWTETTQKLVEQFGYDTKQACHAVRVLDAAIRFWETDFKDFNKAIKYDTYDPMRAVLMGIKAGEYTEENFKLVARMKHDKLMSISQYFDVMQPDTYTLDKVNSLIKSLVYKQIVGRN